MSLILPGTQSLIPVSVLTGFLGGGKTTLLNSLVHDPAMSRTLIVINEFGAISLDHELVAPANEDLVVEMMGGCLCCTIRSDLLRVLRDAALKVASDLSIIFNYAIERRLVPTNPVTYARKPRAGKRHEFLSAAEFTLIGQALTELEADGCNPAGIAILRLILLTGARPSEIEGLTWAEVDFDHQCLRLAQSKTGYSVRPLSLAAVNILSAVERGGSAYVFPATRGDGHFKGAKKIWNQARAKAGLPGRVRYHARHAMATFALADGVDAVSVAAILGHNGRDGAIV